MALQYGNLQRWPRTDLAGIRADSKRDGRVFYNSRSHLCVDGRRQFSWSTNGGRYFTDWRAADDLFEVGQPFYFKYGSKPSYGCNAGMVRLPLSSSDGKDVLLCSMPDDPCGHRIRMSVFASFDGDRSWPVKRLITGDGRCSGYCASS